MVLVALKRHLSINLDLINPIVDANHMIGSLRRRQELTNYTGKTLSQQYGSPHQRFALPGAPKG